MLQQLVEDYQHGDRLKEHIHPFVGPAKGVKKVRLHTTKTALHCLCWYFSEHFSTAGEKDQLILPTTLRQARPNS
jgi:hypothetical protein